LVKTLNFKEPRYIGDPINAVRLFNEKEADELIVLDIVASKNGDEPDYNLIKNIAAECRMPLCYGGGVKNVDQIKKIVSLGVEKVAISSIALDYPSIISEAASIVGCQSVVVVLDVKKNPKTGVYSVYSQNGNHLHSSPIATLAKSIQDLGAGEIVVNSIDRDGLMTGYDHELIDSIYSAVEIPISALGGAGSIQHIKDLFQKFKIIGACAGSLFVFKGKFKAVLINYPDKVKKSEIFSDGDRR
tara:strand:- start:528 stop:1259 length:732 start_codon:yes stop_codon:yes gene_type:complete